MKLKKFYHVAILASDYEKSKQFYVEVVGCEILAEHYREEKQSYKLDLALHGEYIIELFTFPDSVEGSSNQHTLGLMHIAFAVDDVEAALEELHEKNIKTTGLRIDTLTNKKMAYFYDPDGVTLELYEA